VAVPEVKRKGASVLRKAGTFILAAVAVQALSGPKTVNAQVQNQSQFQPILFRIQSRFDPLSGALFYEKIDERGNTV
jgi:hypothetical protein